MPGCFEPCGTFHYLLKYYTEGDGWKEKSRRKKLTSVATSLQGGGKKANPTICGRYSCVAVWLNCTSIELMYPLNLDKSSKKHFRKHFFLFCSFFFFPFLNSSKLEQDIWAGLFYALGFDLPCVPSLSKRQNKPSCL